MPDASNVSAEGAGGGRQGAGGGWQGRHSLAHVLAVEHGVARFALEAPDVPLAVQRDQRLALLELLVAAGALVAGAGAQAQPQAQAARAGRGAPRSDVALAHGDLHAARAQHLLARVRNPLAGGERLAASKQGLNKIRIRKLADALPVAGISKPGAGATQPRNRKLNAGLEN